MKRVTKKVLAILLSIALVFSSIVLTPADFQKTVTADEIASVVTAFSYDFAYTTPGYADGTIRISANEDGVYKVFWGDAEGNKLTKNGYEYSYLARIIVKDGTGSYNIISDYTVIPENAATVLVYKKDALQYTYEIPEERLFAPTGEGYTFGALSDLHFGRYIANDVDDAVAAVDNAFKFMDSVGVEFIGTTGDLTSEGEQDSLDKYNAAIAKYPNLTVLSCTGNHDSRTTVSTSDTAKLDTSLSRWYESLTSTYFTVNEDGTYTSNLDAKYEIPAIGTSLTTEYREVADGETLTKELPALDFVVTNGENVFVFLNEISKTGTTYDTDKLLTTEQMDWLAQQLETYKDKNVFLYVHSYLAVNASNNDAVDNNNCTGDLKNAGGYSYDLDYKDEVTTTDGKNMLALFKQYSNVTMFSGHSHWQYAMQEHNKNLNIGKVNNGAGATLIHLSSVTEPRYIGQDDGHRTELNGEASEGTTVTVYDDCIIYNGIDFTNSQYEAYATYIVPTGDDTTFEPVKDTSYKEATDVITGDEYLEAEDMTRIQLLKSTYNLTLGASYVYSSKGDENTDAVLTDGDSTGTAFMCTKPNKSADQYIIVTLDSEQAVSNLKEFQLYFVNGLTDSSSFNIQISLDGENYETVGTYTNMTYATTVLDVDTSKVSLENYKYIKLNLTGGTKAYGYQIRELAAIGYARNVTPNTAGSSSSLVEGALDEEDLLETDYNLMYAADYTQSSIGSENSEGKLTDGKTSGGFVNTERNSSATNQTFVVDLGKDKIQKVNNIDYFLLYFQNDLTNATAFNISVSLDGETYEKVGDYTNVDLDTNHLDVDLTNITLEEFRYVKLNLTAGKTGYGYQIKEFGLIGVNPIVYPEVENQSTIISSTDKNFALGKTLYVSTTHEGEGEDVSVLNDGKKDSYWSSDWDSTLTEDYIIIDLGEEIHTSNIGSVAVNFKSDNTYCSNYTIEYSKTYNPEDPNEGFYEVAKTKAVSWDILQKYADSNGYVVTNITGVTPDTVRFVKIRMYGHAAYGFQIYEVAVLKKELRLTDAEANISIDDATFTYTGSDVEPKVYVTYAGVDLVEGTDYTLSYDNNLNAGEASYTVSGKGNYKGTVTKSFDIAQKNIADEDVKKSYIIEENSNPLDYFDSEGFLYTGKNIEPNAIMTFDGGWLERNTDYTVSFDDNINSGIGVIKYEGIGNFTGTATLEFLIKARPMKNVTLKVSFDENGNLVVSAGINYVELVENVDYTYTETTDENGNIVVTFTAIDDNLSGTITKTIYNIKNAMITNIPDMEYTGKGVTPDVSITNNGKTLVENVDYTVEYINNIDIGTASVVISGINGYMGVVEKNFEIIKPKETTTQTPTTVKPTTEKPTTANSTTVTPTNAKFKKPARVNVKKVKKLGLKKAKVSWKKIKGAKGYQIRYSTSKKMKKVKKKFVKKNKKSYIIKKLKKKKYYIQVRAYKVVNGKKRYGKWSKKKIVNMKK